MGLDGPVEHVDGQRHLLAAPLGFTLEKHIVAVGLEVAIAVEIHEIDGEVVFQAFDQVPGIGTVATKVEIDRGGKADGFAFGQAYFFVQQLHELLHGVVVGEVGGEVHWGRSGWA
ncbi:hypothetical protein D3C78_1519620 [compost metagenome]